ncbi:beta-glucosidase family protein [Microbacterium marinilacus]|uniref:Glycoside hydrolase family 3 C-terminal domain-containing protein n=1 Tax=Microbacterium marinilacus TaxID=415209 RepID=A0ABP7B9V4_9MICO|nr:glycoside hydrolase family 3 C-terminal domain-containing protein [Microbacterium marinilacus]MBY0687288.1 glycoside hydrolase family 3 C-terminal domain-containing protein [Microbacterium marinilacus]
MTRPADSIPAAVAARAVAPIDAARLGELVGRLSLDEKVRLVTGRDFWTTWPIEHIGLRAMTLSDGPSGVRGPVWDERSPSLNLPSATALSATWDLDVAWRYGAAAAAEARRKGVDVVLGPTINLHRTPTNGRHFEAFSEDPLLTAHLAAAYVRGVQQNGVAATPKHYVANDFERERFTADVRVDERPLRELYLRAFEDAVRNARAWALMSAYNSINGSTATESPLLHAPLNTEWGFDGVVVSDWTAVRSVEASAAADQDLEMPAPGVWGDALAAAVREGRVAESAIDRKVTRILGLAARVGALEGFEPVSVAPTWREDGVGFAREAAAEGMVLLRNDGVLPLAAPLARVAVIGDNAVRARTQGGGSATVLPESVTTPLDGLRRALPDAEVDYRVGALAQSGVAEFPLAQIRNPATGEPGARVRLFDAAGTEIHHEDRRATSLVWFGGEAPVARTASIELHTVYTPVETGAVRIGFGSVGLGRVHLDGALVHEADVSAEGDDLGAALLQPPSSTVEVDVVAGRPIDVRVTLARHAPGTGDLDGAMGLDIGWEPAGVDADALIAEAVDAAAAADVAVVVVGTGAKVESEGFDRESLALPGRQDDLVAAVTAANPRTVVVVNAGAPVLMPWRDDVAAVLVGWFGGQEFGSALADVLVGHAEPGGRLPTTWPVSEADVPILHADVVGGRVRYDEGVHIGYRAWQRAGSRPAYAFGSGLGYTTWQVEDARLSDASVALDGEVALEVTVTNTGDRAGKHVLQVYARREASVVDRPASWLVGFATVRAEPGESATARIVVAGRDLAHWDDGWRLEAGEFVLAVGSSVEVTVRDLVVTARA